MTISSFSKTLHDEDTEFRDIKHSSEDIAPYITCVKLKRLTQNNRHQFFQQIGLTDEQLLLFSSQEEGDCELPYREKENSTCSFSQKNINIQLDFKMIIVSKINTRVIRKKRSNNDNITHYIWISQIIQRSNTIYRHEYFYFSSYKSKRHLP